MLTFFCPKCWTEIDGEDKVCPNCGYDLSRYASLSLEDKLLLSLRHPVQENRIMAIKILQNIGSQRAIPEFERLFQIENEDYFVAEAILTLAAKIGSPHGLALLQKAKLHPSSLVRRLVDELLNNARSK